MTSQLTWLFWFYYKIGYILWNLFINDAENRFFFFICYKLAKLDQITFYYTEMAGKLLNLNLASFKNYLTSVTLSY